MLDVLLVCTGNICRSPIAAGLLRDRSNVLPAPLRISSSGTGAETGRPPTPEAVEAAAEVGVDIAAHRSRPVVREDVEGADLVLVMTEDHGEAIRAMVPGASDRIFTLKELAALLNALPEPSTLSSDEARQRITAAARLRDRGHPVPDSEVMDPIGLSLKAYQAATWEMERAVDEVVRGLFGTPVDEAPERNG